MNSGKVDVKVSMSHSRTFGDWTDLRLEMLGPVHALGNRRFSWSRVRRVLGQERGLAPVLGPPWAERLAAIAGISEFTSDFLTL